MVALLDVNLLAVLVAAVLQMALGFLWYSPMLFGNTWMKLAGIKTDPKKVKAEMPKSAFFGFLTALVMVFILAQVVGYTQAKTLVDGVMSGFWMWLGFVATVMAGIVLWEGKPFKLYALNVGYYLVTLVISGAILALWR